MTTHWLFRGTQLMALVGDPAAIVMLLPRDFVTLEQRQRNKDLWWDFPMPEGYGVRWTVVEGTHGGRVEGWELFRFDAAGKFVAVVTPVTDPGLRAWSEQAKPPIEARVTSTVLHCSWVLER